MASAAIATIASRVKGLLQRPRQLPAPGSKLEKLPHEILLSIGDHLNIVDIACLFLSSKFLRQYLKPSSLGVFNLTDEPNLLRQDLLTRLARDNGQYYYCFQCSHLHAVAMLAQSLRWLSSGTQWSPHFGGLTLSDNSMQCLQAYVTLPEHIFSFHHVQLVMARHRHGPGHGFPLQVLAFREIHDLYPKNRLTILFSVEPEIIEHELYMRVQQWAHVHDGQVSRIGDFEVFKICRHVSGFWRVQFPHFFACKMTHGDSRPDCATCHQYLVCSICRVEFNVHQLDLGPEGSAVVITKWIKLGSGHSPADIHWRRLMEPAGREDAQISAARVDDTARLLFEQHAEKKVEVLTSEHASLLRGEAFRRTFQFQRTKPALYHGECDVWLEKELLHKPPRKIWTPW